MGVYNKTSVIKPDRCSSLSALLPSASQSAGDAVLSFALCPNVGCNFVGQFLMKTKKTPKTPKPSSRVYCNRVKLLTILTQEIGVCMAGGQAGMAMEPLMSLSMEWFDNANHEVGVVLRIITRRCHVRTTTFISSALLNVLVLAPPAPRAISKSS